MRFTATREEPTGVRRVHAELRLGLHLPVGHGRVED